MKHFTFLLLLAITTYTSAQKIYHTKLTIGYGLYSLQEVDDVVSTVTLNGNNILDLKLDQSRYSPVYFGEFGAYLLNGILNLSINASYSKFTEDYVYTLNNTSETSSIENNYYSLMMGTNIYYLGPIHMVELYSGGYVGAYVNRASNNPEEIKIKEASELAYHINVLGVRVGKDIGAHIEFGYGFLGIVNAGISAQF